jgi:hypothetical protein
MRFIGTEMAQIRCQHRRPVPSAFVISKPANLIFIYPKKTVSFTLGYHGVAVKVACVVPSNALIRVRLPTNWVSDRKPGEVFAFSSV